MWLTKEITGRTNLIPALRRHKMTYIKQNVNFILTFITLALALLVAGSTVFFNTNLQKTASDLSQTEKEIENLKGNLNLEIAKLTDVEEDIELQEKRETGLSEQYLEVKRSYDQLETEKNRLQNQITDAEKSLQKMQSDIQTCVGDKKEIWEESKSVNTEIERLKGAIDSLEDQIDTCEAS